MPLPNRSNRGCPLGRFRRIAYVARIQGYFRIVTKAIGCACFLVLSLCAIATTLAAAPQKTQKPLEPIRFMALIAGDVLPENVIALVKALAWLLNLANSPARTGKDLRITRSIPTGLKQYQIAEKLDPDSVETRLCLAGVLLHCKNWKRRRQLNLKTRKSFIKSGDSGIQQKKPFARFMTL
jgi:hypothetical protein